MGYFFISSFCQPRELPITFEAKYAGPGCRCPDGQSPVAWQISWILATCKSDCTKGIGFRCGREGAILCSKGTVVVCIKGTNCPHEDDSRTMKAAVTFYDNKTLKLTFLNPVPREEAGNTNFEVEETDVMTLPAGILIGGISYSSMKTIASNYLINYSDGQFGSVIINAELN